MASNWSVLPTKSSNLRVFFHSRSCSFRNLVETSSSLKAVMEEGSRGASPPVCEATVISQWGPRTSKGWANSGCLKRVTTELVKEAISMRRQRGKMVQNSKGQKRRTRYQPRVFEVRTTRTLGLGDDMAVVLYCFGLWLDDFWLPLWFYIYDSDMQDFTRRRLLLIHILSSIMAAMQALNSLIDKVARRVCVGIGIIAYSGGISTGHGILRCFIRELWPILFFFKMKVSNTNFLRL